jgi:hypothetical protein
MLIIQAASPGSASNTKGPMADEIGPDPPRAAIDEAFEPCEALAVPQGAAAAAAPLGAAGTANATG